MRATHCCGQNILGKRAVILAHHYQRADVYRHADLTGDSLKLSYLAAQTDADFLVFCGVHFMAEVADILSSPEQIAILPDLAAGCSMADMANLSNVERAWRELSEILDPDESITPVTYINSAADLKAFVVSTRVLSAHPVMPVKFCFGHLISGKRFCFFLISISVVGVGINWAFHSMKCQYGILMSQWAG